MDIQKAAVYVSLSSEKQDPTSPYRLSLELLENMQ